MNIAHPDYFLLGFFGAASLELLRAYEYRSRLSAAKYKALLRSPLYWAVVLGMLSSSGFIAWAVNADSTNVATWHVVATGIAARSIVRDLAGVSQAVKPTTLGEKQVSLRDIFP